MTEAFPEEDIDLLHTLLESQGHRNVLRMPDGMALDIRALVIDLGRLVGSHPSARQPLTETKRVWKGSNGCIVSVILIPYRVPAHPPWPAPSRAAPCRAVFCRRFLDSLTVARPCGALGIFVAKDPPTGCGRT